jgi:hypothetical protein
MQKIKSNFYFLENQTVSKSWKFHEWLIKFENAFAYLKSIFYKVEFG